MWIFNAIETQCQPQAIAIVFSVFIMYTLQIKFFVVRMSFSRWLQNTHFNALDIFTEMSVSNRICTPQRPHI